MLPQYESLLTDAPPCVAEGPSAHTYECLTERHLQAMWLEQKYFKGLATIESESIEVISPGIWNAEAGPDFLKAHIKINGREYFGDIELHLHSESWMHHGHHLDPRYDHVMLHVAFWKPHSIKSIATSTGKSIPQACFENFLTISPNRIVQLVDLDLYPYKKFIGSGRCSQTLFRTLSEDKITTFFRNAAAWRLSQKRQYLQAHVEFPSYLMGAGIAMALGYKNNTEAFLELFLNLLPHRHLPEEMLLAMGMKACGFFDEVYCQKWESSERYKQLSGLMQQSPKLLPQVHLTLHQIRPLNHPLRRLVVLAKMVSDPALTEFFPQMQQCWQHHWTQLGAKKACRLLCEQLRALLPTYVDDYWNRHYSFEELPRKEFLPLSGDNLKNEILVNAFLPLLQESVLQRADPKEIAAFEAFYGSMPFSDNSKTSYLIHRFFGDTPKGALLQHADMEQGAYQLHRDFCLHYEASCAGCPFVDRFTNSHC